MGLEVNAQWHLKVADLIADKFNRRDNPHTPAIQPSTGSVRVAKAVKVSEQRGHWLLPAWPGLTKRDFNDLLTAPIFPIGLSYRKQQSVDGTPSRNSSQFAMHDGLHYEVAVLSGCREFFRPRQRPEDLRQLATSRANYVQRVRDVLKATASTSAMQDAVEELLFEVMHEYTGFAPRTSVSNETELPLLVAEYAPRAQRFLEKTAQNPNHVEGVGGMVMLQLAVHSWAAERGCSVSEAAQQFADALASLTKVS
jgi:hypothetical protein